MASSIGHLFIVSAASGAGKTSLVREVTKKINNLVPLASYTTRKKRANETEGLDYFFVSKEKFADMDAKGEFLESSTVFDNYYGCSKDLVAKLLDEGKDLILAIDWQGAKKIEHNLLHVNLNPYVECTKIFILPPSLKALNDRLYHRGQDDLVVIQKRLDLAKKEILHYPDYDYLIINDSFNQAVSDLISIINAVRLTTDRQSKLHAQLIECLLGTH